MNNKRVTVERVYELGTQFNMAQRLVKASGHDEAFVQELEDLDNKLRELGLVVLKSHHTIELEDTFAVLESSLGSIVGSLSMTNPNASKTPILDALGQIQCPRLDDEYSRLSSEALTLVNHLKADPRGISDEEYIAVIGRISELQRQMNAKRQDKVNIIL